MEDQANNNEETITETPQGRAVALITLTCYRENCTRALASILKCGAEHFCRVIIASPYGEPTHCGAAWEQQRAALQAAGIPVEIRIRWDPAKHVPPPPAQYVLEVPPACHFRASALYALEQAMEESQSERVVFALACENQMSVVRWRDWLAYGFLVLLTAMDLLWWIFEAGKYHRDNDLCAALIVQRGERRIIGQRVPWLSRFYNGACERRIAHGEAVVKPVGSDVGMTGWEAVQWIVYKHRTLRWPLGFWWFPALFGYLAFLGIGWQIMALRSAAAAAGQQLEYWTAGAFWSAIYTAVVIGLWLALFLSKRATGGAYSFPGAYAAAFAWPVYYLAFPVLYVLGRWMPPRREPTKRGKRWLESQRQKDE